MPQTTLPTKQQVPIKMKQAWKLEADLFSPVLHECVEGVNAGSYGTWNAAI